MPQNEGYEAQFRFIHQKSDNRQNFDCLRYCECHSIDKKGWEDYWMSILAFNSALFLLSPLNLPIFGQNLIFPFITRCLNIIFVIKISIYYGYNFWIGAKLGRKQISQQKIKKTATEWPLLSFFRKIENFNFIFCL